LIKCLKIFEIDPDLEVIQNEGELLNEFEDGVDRFFRTHIIKSIEHMNTKVARFRNETSDIFRYCRDCFIVEDFEENSKNIANILKSNMHFSVKNKFLLVMLNYEFEKRELGYADADPDEVEEILSIMKMETNDGIELLNNEFIIHQNMLPDLGNHLQKCVFVYKSFLENFEENNRNENFHLKILDKQDKTISNYFINLMNSVLVADDEVMSRLAQRFIKRTAKSYTEGQDQYEEVEKQIRVIMSQRKRTSVQNIFTEIFPLLDIVKLEEAGHDVESLSQETFNLMRQNNPSAYTDFVSHPVDGKKYILSNENRSIYLSIEQGLIDDHVVKVDTSKSREIVISIPKNQVKSN